MVTNSDEEEEMTKNPRLRGLSKSEQKDVRCRKDASMHFAKVATAGPSPMSFGNMIDELMDSDLDVYDKLGAPSRQMQFMPIENQMAGDQGSDPSQSGGSYSEEPHSCLQNSGHMVLPGQQRM